MHTVSSVHVSAPIPDTPTARAARPCVHTVSSVHVQYQAESSTMASAVSTGGGGEEYHGGAKDATPQ
eukprot:2254795-Rhodomonas_salina.1